jgi:enediyne biosynthesis protein E3
MVHVGAGWVLARLHRKVEPSLARLDPLLGWLVVDGYGFHEGYFHWQRYVKEQRLPKQLSGYALRVFDQGLGRSLWFVDGADVERIPGTIAAFPQQRRADLWSGVGLACAYAGGVDLSEIEHLRSAAELYQPYLSQGAAFAAKARQRAGNPANHTELACQILCGLCAEISAEITDLALENLPHDGMVPAYEIWRQRIQAKFSLREVAV